MKWLLLAIALFSFSFTSLSSEECRFFNSDLFEPMTKLTKGKYKGKCLDTEKVRGLVKLTESDLQRTGLQIDFSEDKLVLANFRHEKKFWIASLPYGEDSIKRIVVQVERFPPEWLAAHSQIRIDLNEGYSVKLYGQNETNFGETRELSSFIVSFEAQSSKDGPKYSLLKGIRKTFAIVPVLKSIPEYKRIVKLLKHSNEQYVLNLNSKQSFEMVEKSFERAFLTMEKQFFYNTLRRNCTTEMMIPLDEVTGYKRHFFRRLSELLPVRVGRILKKRGLVAEELLPIEKELE